MSKCAAVALLLAVATVLGATVLREPVAWAAQGIDAKIVGPLDGDGSVKVHEQGTADVNVTNRALPVREQGAVEVATDPAKPLKVEDSFEPWQRADMIVSLTVPAGRLGVVDYVSGRCTDDDGPYQPGEGAMVGIGVRTTEDGHTVEHFVPSAFSYSNHSRLGSQGATGQVVRIYADPGTEIRATPAGYGDCAVALSGHLERLN